MNLTEARDRFQELDVARALGDLSSDERSEYQSLQKEFNLESDSFWDSFISSVEDIYSDKEAQFPEQFEQQVTASIFEDQASESSQSSPSENSSGPRLVEDSNETSRSPIIAFISQPALGWAAAAILGVFMLIQAPNSDSAGNKKIQKVTLADKRDLLLKKDSTISLALSEGEKSFGNIVWNSELQEGYMTLSNVSVNDPAKSQYQLWIVDNDQFAKPVDGGVFDVVPGEAIVVQIDAALKVPNASSFMITEEQPGGVVVSKGEKVVAVASL